MLMEKFQAGEPARKKVQMSGMVAEQPVLVMKLL